MTRDPRHNPTDLARLTLNCVTQNEWSNSAIPGDVSRRLQRKLWRSYNGSAGVGEARGTLLWSFIRGTLQVLNCGTWFGDPVFF